jgi:hypothetical protein
MESKKLNYTTLPRQILSDWENGKLSNPERNLLFFLRSKGNPFGYCSVEMGALAIDAFNSPVDKSYINKLLLSLRSKRYIWYENRKGHRGSFQVHLDLWLMKDGGLRMLDQYFSQTPVRNKEVEVTQNQTEDEEEDEELSQRSKDLIKSIRAIAGGKKMNASVRGYDNDNENKKENDLTTKGREKLY